jgi:hypothetical protein
MIKPEERNPNYWTKVSSDTYVRIPHAVMSMNTRQISAFTVTMATGECALHQAFCYGRQRPLFLTFAAPKPFRKSELGAFPGQRLPIPKYNRRHLAARQMMISRSAAKKGIHGDKTQPDSRCAALSREIGAFERHSDFVKQRWRERTVLHVERSCS